MKCFMEWEDAMDNLLYRDDLNKFVEIGCSSEAKTA
jgi:hypothetical protein